MIQGSRQKRIIDLALKKGWLIKPAPEHNPSLASSNFMNAYKQDNAVGMIYHYLDFVFKLRLLQARLLDTYFTDSALDEYSNALSFINNATNQGFLLLEILAKVAPVGDKDLDGAMDIYLTHKENNTPQKQTKAEIRKLIYGG